MKTMTNAQRQNLSRTQELPIIGADGSLSAETQAWLTALAQSRHPCERTIREPSDRGASIAEMRRGLRRTRIDMPCVAVAS